MAEPPQPRADPQPPIPNPCERSELRTVLQREIELAPVRLVFRDWPGFAGPVVHLAPLHPSEPELIVTLAQVLAPRWRVLSIEQPLGRMDEVHAAHVAELIEQFGFGSVILIGEGSSAAVALLVAARHAPDRISGIVLLDPPLEMPPRPDELGCPTFEVDTTSSEALADRPWVAAVEAFVRACCGCSPSP